ncbi:MAG TPA: POTRA domain-containing protein, partial [Rhizomicrobium sp.]
MWKRTRFCRLTFLGVCAVLAGTADKSAQAADPQPYKIVFPATGSSPIDEALRASAQLVTLNSKAPVPPFALIERAKDDIPRLQTALDSFGYYQNNVTITIADRDLADADLPVVLDAVPQGTAVTVKVSVTMGPLYRLGNITIEGLLLESARAALGIKSGDPALAGAVLDAQTRLVSALQEDGYALAKVDSPVATANDAAHLIDVVYKVAAGPQIDIGAIDFKGLKDVNESFARRALTVKSGERYRPSRIEAARQSLAGLGVFSGVSVHAADSLSADGRIPLTFDVQERKPHAVTLAGTYSTDLGISFSTTWSHRNLFGNAEQLNLTAAAQLGGNALTKPGYQVGAQFIKPDFLARDQALELDLNAVKQSLQAYDQTALLEKIA